jgi:hypothetical protein
MSEDSELPPADGRASSPERAADPPPTRPSLPSSVDDVPREGEPTERRRPTTLVELYTLPKIGAPDLLASLVKRDAWKTSVEDEEAALHLLADRDHDLSKTRTLAQHVATSHDGRFAASFERFLVSAATRALDGTPSWPPEQRADGPAVFARVLAHHAESLREKDPPRELFNALMIAQSILMARYRLDVETAVPALSRTLGPPASLRGDRRNPRLTRLRALGDPRLTVDALRIWLDVLSPWIERAVNAETRADQAEANVRRHEGIGQDLERETRRLRTELRSAHDEIALLHANMRAHSSVARSPASSRTMSSHSSRRSVRASTSIHPASPTRSSASKTSSMNF